MIVSASEPQHPQELQGLSTYHFKDATVSILRAYLLEGPEALIKSGTPSPQQLEDIGISFWSDYCEKRGGAEMAGFIQGKRALIQRAARIGRLEYLLKSAAKIWCDEFIAEFEAEERYGKETAAMRIATTPEEYERALKCIEAKLKADAMRLDELAAESDTVKKDGKSEQQKRKEASDSLTNEIIAIEETLKIGQINEETTTLEKYCGYVRRTHQHIAAHNRQNRKV